MAVEHLEELAALGSSDPTGSSGPLPRDQAGAITHVQGLFDAVIALGSDLDLPAVLRRIVQAAVELADCRYGALGIIGADSSLREFLTVGIDEDLTSVIGDPPHGEGILGVLIHDPKPLRLADLTTHPAAFGFPPGHPVMHTFLGVPIRVHGEVFGNLYLTEKNGGATFDEADERTVLALAAAAGAAIENARLYADAARNQASLQASSDITTALLSGADTDEVLHTVAMRARELAATPMALIAFPDVAGRLTIEVCVGPSSTNFIGATLPLDSVSGQIVSTPGEGAIVSELLLVAVGQSATSTHLGVPAMLVPLNFAEKHRHAVLAVVDTPGRSFDTELLLALESFAAQAAVALELAESRRQAERLAVFEDRDRIARDLHDLVIQRLFAAGMHLQSTILVEYDEQTIARIQSVVSDLDLTIREIRSTIFGLQNQERETGRNVAAGVLEVIDECSERLGLTPNVELIGLSNAHVDPAVAADLVAAIRESLSNVARHAAANQLAVIVAVESDVITLRVVDDGVGMGESDRRSGLANLAERAARHGGSLRAMTLEAGGSEVIWSAPINPAPQRR